MTNQLQPKSKIIIFNKIDLTRAITVASKEKIKKKHERVLKVKVKKSKSYKEVEAEITEKTILDANNNSIGSYIEECHPDIRRFIGSNGIGIVTAKCGELTVITRNDLRVVIKTISASSRKVKISDKRGKILFDEITIAKAIKKEKDGNRDNDKDRRNN